MASGLSVQPTRVDLSPLILFYFSTLWTLYIARPCDKDAYIFKNEIMPSSLPITLCQSLWLVLTCVISFKFMIAICHLMGEEQETETHSDSFPKIFSHWILELRLGPRYLWLHSSHSFHYTLFVQSPLSRKKLFALSLTISLVETPFHYIIFMLTLPSDRKLSWVQWDLEFFGYSDMVSKAFILYMKEV